MTIPSALTLKFKIFQKVELIDLCTERLVYRVTFCVFDLANDRRRSSVSRKPVPVSNVYFLLRGTCTTTLGWRVSV